MTFPVVTICGSMRYYPGMLSAAERLTRTNWIVLMPFVTHNGGVKLPDDNFATMLAEMHIAKMRLSDAIYVMGPHIGESTTAEIAWAREHKLAVMGWAGSHV